MEQPNPLQDLDTALRQGARARRAVIDQQTYPIGDYPPPRPQTAAPRRGANVILRLAWMLGLSGTITAGVLLALAGVMQFVATPPSPPVAERPTPPNTLAEPVRSLVAGIEQAERNLGKRLNPSFGFATAWPGHVQALGETLAHPPTTLPAPVEQEVTAIRHDLVAAADFVRRQWQAPSDAPQTPGMPQIPGDPANPSNSGTPTGLFPVPVDPALGTATG
ncbi:MAG: hypothetical protein AAF333_10330 [Planctomycetota bacterium]